MSTAFAENTPDEGCFVTNSLDSTIKKYTSDYNSLLAFSSVLLLYMSKNAKQKMHLCVGMYVATISINLQR